MESLRKNHTRKARIKKPTVTEMKTVLEGLIRDLTQAQKVSKLEGRSTEIPYVGLQREQM